ncbi:type I 3-dehydroquinate dehydratase [Lentibacillus sediminis]|uniref:type I 3-dehydroquinate dehydratase n=1 Tax=Lentibacillus sediminis TaxID=1940529 RepID=UPI001863E2A4|nr:type I 3-dehydroquinate dehydratase [Lentibacillus sediminis]
MLQLKQIRIGEGKPKVIVPLIGRTEDELVQEAEAVKKLGPDMIEWRADAFAGVKSLKATGKMLAKFRAVLPELPLIFTFRSEREGGHTSAGESFYEELLDMVLESQAADAVDVELFTGRDSVERLVEKAKTHGVPVVMSNHDFAKTPEKAEILTRLQAMEDYDADMLKIAVMPNSTADLLVLLDATQTWKSKGEKQPLITMAMGQLGLVSRLAGEVFGSAATFGAGVEASAPGQIDVADLKAVLHIIHRYS